MFGGLPGDFCFLGGDLLFVVFAYLNEGLLLGGEVEVVGGAESGFVIAVGGDEGEDGFVV